MGEDFILDDGSVVVDKDVFNGKGGDFGNKDAAEGICYRSVDANEGEGTVERLMFVKLDLKSLQDDRKPWPGWKVLHLVRTYVSEFFQVPFMIFPWVMTRDVG